MFTDVAGCSFQVTNAYLRHSGFDVCNLKCLINGATRGTSHHDVEARKRVLSLSQCFCLLITYSCNISFSGFRLALDGSAQRGIVMQSSSGLVRQHSHESLPPPPSYNQSVPGLQATQLPPANGKCEYMRCLHMFPLSYL